MTRNLNKIIISVVICLILLAVPGSIVFAAEPHEDPEAAVLVFSGISLFRYYSDSLDFVLQKDPVRVETILDKMPFANLPENLKEPASDFASSVTDISFLIVTVDENLNRLRELVAQYRIEEVTELKSQTSDNISQANRQLRFIEQTVVDIGEDLEVDSAPQDSDLRFSYNEVLEKIGLIREIVILHQVLLDSLYIAVDELLESTSVTLEVNPVVTFVGDDIRYEGVLTSEGEPLAEREVSILLNGIRYVTTETDAYGRYQDKLQIPYWYIPEIKVQALYYPQDTDIGRYMASFSQAVRLEIFFYEASLELTVEDKAYPGLETIITGKFDYNGPSPAKERDAEIYLDDVLIAEFEVQDEFTQEIRLDPATTTGEHVITISSIATGRYAMVVASAMLNVTRAVPILDLDVPRISLIPDSIGLRGRVYSELGPLRRTSIVMELGSSKVQLLSSDDGTFNTEISAGPRWSIVGSQDLVIHIVPQEPWHAPVSTTRSILQVNMINLGVIVGFIVFFGFYLPGRLRKKPGFYTRKTITPETATTQPEPVPVYSDRITLIPVTHGDSKAAGGPLNRIFYWYRLLIRFIQERARALILPHQTLREFATENNHLLGRAARYFTELTRIGERILYSQYSPTDEDAEKAVTLSQSILDESELGRKTQSSYPGDTRAETKEEIRDEGI